MCKKNGMYLKNNTSATINKGVLWNDQSNPFLNDFYKNGYQLDNNNQSYYDDGETIFETIPLEKKL